MVRSKGRFLVGHWIKQRVDKLVKKHKSNNPFEIADSLGIEISSAELGETLGFYFYDSRMKFININNSLDETTQRFVCAHELGHAILHPKSNTPFLRKNTLFSVERIEVEANKFAVELLLPDESIYAYAHTRLSLGEIAEIHGVPRKLAKLKTYN
jgi:Zn-dependent peptidase ImmA (M78 family)